MKPLFFTLVMSALILNGSYAQQSFDDVYFRPSEANKEKQAFKLKPQSKPMYKNGAKEIIFIQDDDISTIVSKGDTLFVLSELNDSISYNDSLEMVDEGYYLNQFSGGKTEYEYAERIRRFHNPKYSIHISDPQYTDIYFLNSHDWNVYVDGSYAWVTPTWTNPFWNNYYWRPYSYNSWYWRNSIWGPGSLYSGWYNPGFYGYNHFGSYYGGYYGSYYGGYYGGGYYNYHHPYYGGYYPHGGYSYVNKEPRNKNYSENTRREQYYSGSTRQTISGSSARVSGDRPVQTISRSSVSASDRTVRINNSNATAITRNGASAVRSQDFSTGRSSPGIRASGEEQRGATRNAEVINTRPRTTSEVSNSSRGEAATVSTNRTNTTTRSTVTPSTRSTYTPSVRSSSSSSGTTTRESSTTETRRSTYTPSSSSSSSSSSSVRSSTPSYSGSSSSGSSSGGSRSSGESSGGGRR